MRVILESTQKIVELVINGQSVPARIWEGHTEGGVACHAYITRIAVHKDLDSAQFDQELLAQPAVQPSTDIAAIPTRLVL